MNLPISARIGNKCVKGPCQDTIAALWAGNVRPSIGTRRTMGALDGKNITTMLISCRHPIGTPRGHREGDSGAAAYVGRGVSRRLIKPGGLSPG